MRDIVDHLEIQFGTSILADLVDQPLTRNQQPVRLFDQTKKTAEYYYRADDRGKPFIKNFQTGDCWYPLTAYCKVYDLDLNTAVKELCHQYGLSSSSFHSRAEYHTQLRPRPRPQHAIHACATEDVAYLPMEIYQRSQSQFERNGLYQYLNRLVGRKKADFLMSTYQLGTSRHWIYEQALSTSLPQIDVAGNLRQVKVMPFHPQTGRRAKVKDDAQRWDFRTKQYTSDAEEKVWFAGKSLIKGKRQKLQQCLFGEHLLNEYPNKRIALVEGESTAIICSVYWAKYIWLATGGSNGCRWYDPSVFEVLQNREVILWPDSGKYDDWSKKAQALQQIGHSIRVSRYVEDKAPIGKTNIDLRDLLITPHWYKEGKVVFGEELKVEPCSNYPTSWN